METLNISIGNKAVRKMALLLLDDDNGINLEAYGFLSAMLIEAGENEFDMACDVGEQLGVLG